MKRKSERALALAAFIAFAGGNINQVSALPIPVAATAWHSYLTPVACKYGSGKCANVKAGQARPSYDKIGPQDLTVDPDCKAYGNCHDGPNGAPAAAAARARPRLIVTGGTNTGRHSNGH